MNPRRSGNRAGLAPPLAWAGVLIYAQFAGQTPWQYFSQQMHGEEKI
jgi:hypothetical protein